MTTLLNMLRHVSSLLKPSHALRFAHNKSQSPSMAYENFIELPHPIVSLTSPPTTTVSLAYFTQSIYTARLFLKHAKHSPTKRFLHCYSLYLECCSSDVYLANSLTPFIFWFSYQLSEAFPDHLT